MSYLKQLCYVTVGRNRYSGLGGLANRVPRLVGVGHWKEVRMGLTVLEVDVGNPSTPDVTERIEFLIDSGAIYSVVLTPVLERLGIKLLAEPRLVGAGRRLEDSPQEGSSPLQVPRRVGVGRRGCHLW